MHVGLIPDGNRRYMKKKGITSIEESYQMGINKFFDFLNWAKELGANELTIYALSIENLKSRSSPEITALLALFSSQAQRAMNDERIMKNSIRVNICGDMDYLRNEAGVSEDVIKNLRTLEEKTMSNKDFTINLAIAYGGRQEILNAAKSVCAHNLELTEENLKKFLWVKNYPDLIVRTSEERLSNFLTWQSAYSEIYFLDKLWQEMEKSDLESIISDYNSRERRFGK